MSNILSIKSKSLNYVNSSAIILPWHYSSISQGTWENYIHSSNIFNLYFYNTSNTINDSINYKISLSPGIYTFAIYSAKGANRAILTLLVDSSPVGTLDLYDPDTLWNTISSIPNIVIPSFSYYTITLKAASKNVASSGYYLPINSLSFHKQ